MKAKAKKSSLSPKLPPEKSSHRTATAKADWLSAAVHAAIVPPRLPIWFDKMAEGPDKEALRQLHADYNAGAFEGRAISHIFAEVKKHINIPVERHMFVTWLKRAI